MHRHRKFDMPENPASDRRHGSRASAENTVENTFAIDEGPSQRHDSMAATKLSATSHAGPKRPGTGEEARKVPHWEAFRLPFLQSYGEFEQFLPRPSASNALVHTHLKTTQRSPPQSRG